MPPTALLPWLFSYTPLWPNRWFYAGHWLTIGWPPVASHYIPKWWKGLVHLLFLTSGILEKQIHIEKPSWETVTLYGLRRILSLSCTVNRINSGFSGSSPTGPTTYCQQSKWTILHINKDTTNANFTLGAWASSFLAWNIGAKWSRLLAQPTKVASLGLSKNSCYIVYAVISVKGSLWSSMTADECRFWKCIRFEEYSAKLVLAKSKVLDDEKTCK